MIQTATGDWSVSVSRGAYGVPGNVGVVMLDAGDRTKRHELVIDAAGVPPDALVADAIQFVVDVACGAHRPRPEGS